MEGSIGPVLIDAQDMYSRQGRTWDCQETCIVRVPWSFMLIIYMFVFQFEYSYGSGSGSSSSIEPIDKRPCDFTAAVVTRGIVDATPILFGTTKEGIIELMD